MILYKSSVSGDILTFFSVLAEVDKEQEDAAEDAAAKAAKEAAYTDRLDEWLAKESSKLEFSGYDDTTFITATKLDLKDKKWVAFDENLPLNLRDDLLVVIKDRSKKETTDNSIRIIHVGDVAQAAIEKFYVANVNKKENYQDLTLEQIKEMVFPTGLDAWIADADLHTLSVKERKTKKELLTEIFEEWVTQESDALRVATNSSQEINIKQLKNSAIGTNILPKEIKTTLLASVKKELKGVKNFGEASSTLLNFLTTDKFTSIVFDPTTPVAWYENLTKEEIQKIQFPNGLGVWVSGTKGEDTKDVANGYNEQFKTWTDSLQSLNTDLNSTLTKYYSIF
ncbi:MAG: hypothetical protein GY810_07845 [Aureispira sp.]|nr:hypothetical protein [Aureispira sp.]